MLSGARWRFVIEAPLDCKFLFCGQMDQGARCTSIYSMWRSPVYIYKLMASGAIYTGALLALSLFCE